MLLFLGEIAAGALLLYLGAEWLVRGSGGLARAFGVPALVVGLTVIAYGTSMPEMVVSSLAAHEGKAGIALGNVIGSNIANLALILGLTAAICPLKVEGTLIKRELPVMAVSVLLIPAVLWNGVVSRLEGGLLLAAALAFTLWTVRPVLTQRLPPGDASKGEGKPEKLGRGKLALLSLLGLVLLVAGGKVLVEGAVGLALGLGLSERLVGLTIVAVGTSLPELAASLVAAARGHPSLAVGNVVGSNIFNVFFVLGSAALVSPLHMPFAEVRADTLVLIGITAFSLLMMRSARTLSRAEGAVMLACYVGFCVALARG